MDKKSLVALNILYFLVWLSFFMDIFGNYPGTTLKELDVDGDAKIGGDLTVEGTISGSIDADRVYTVDGTEPLPSYSYKDEKSLGWYRSAPGETSYSSGGTKRVRLSGTDSEYYVPVKAPSVDVAGEGKFGEVKAGEVVSGGYECSGQQGMYFTTNLPFALLGSDTCDIEVSPGLLASVCTFKPTSTDFPLPVTAQNISTTNLTATTAAIDTLTIGTSLSYPVKRLTARATTTQAIPNNGTVKVTMTGNLGTGTVGWGAISYPTADFKVPVDGYYMICANVTWAASTGTTGWVQIWLNKNGATTDPRYSSSIMQNLASTTKELSQNTGCLVPLATTDTFNVWVQQVSGASRDLLNTAEWNRAILTMQYVSPL